jgi:shikimate kinase
VLIGYRGSGKSTVGRLVAEHLAWTLLDTDERVTAAAGKSIKEIFQQHGEAHFRRLESEQVAGIGLLRRHVISLGGGAVLAEANRNAIAAAAGAVVYLRAHPAALWKRIQDDPATAVKRPNLTALAGGIDEIRALLQQREPIYRQLASAEIDVSDLTPQQSAAAVLQIVRDLKLVQ